VQTRGAPTVIFATDSGGLEQPLKSMIDIVLPDLCSISVRKEGGLHSFRQRTVRASFGISPQGIPKLGWNGNEATLVELGVPHSQHCVRKVHIAHGQMQRLTGSQSSSVQDQEQCMEGITIKADGMLAADIDGLKQELQFLTGVDVR
jgi:hypothetical protein